MKRLKDITKRVFPTMGNQAVQYPQKPYPVPRNDGTVSRTALENTRPSMMLDHGIA